MRENRPFTQEEDSIIRELYENQNIKKWSIIARILTDDHNLIRNAKQCRDRLLLYYIGINNILILQWQLNGTLKTNKSFIGCIMRSETSGLLLLKNSQAGK